MKKFLFLCLFATTIVFGQNKKIVASEINWWGYKVAKTESSSHTGTLNLKSGNLEMKGKSLSGGTFVFDMNSINSTDLEGEWKTKLDGHLKNNDFFDVNKFPTAVYKITSVKKNSDKIYNYIISGNLTVKGKTSEVSFPAKIQYSKGVLTIVSNKFSFDRQKFDVVYKSSMKDVLVKDDIEMLVKITAK